MVSALLRSPQLEAARYSSIEVLVPGSSVVKLYGSRGWGKIEACLLDPNPNTTCLGLPVRTAEKTPGVVPGGVNCLAVLTGSPRQVVSGKRIQALEKYGRLKFKAMFQIGSDSSRWQYNSLEKRRA